VLRKPCLVNLTPTPPTGLRADGSVLWSWKSNDSKEMIQKIVGNRSGTRGQATLILPRPGNKTEAGGTERWERVLQHPFELTVRGIIKYRVSSGRRMGGALLCGTEIRTVSLLGGVCSGSLSSPGNKTEAGGTERWERVLQHPFELTVRGIIKYQLPLLPALCASCLSFVSWSGQTDLSFGAGSQMIPRR
jgi:hypothetical protein